jgi:OOP family OmpA-OmpF porin
VRRLLVSALVVAVAAPAFANNPSGPYVGGGFGQFDLHIENLNDVGQAVTTIAHSNDDAWKVFAGWRFNPYIALEGAYIDLGKPGGGYADSGSDGRYNVSFDGFAPTVIGSIPLGPVELFAKAGYYYYDVKLNVNVNSVDTAHVESSHERADFLYGGGVGVTIANHLHLRGEYEQINLADYHSSDALWLTAAWRF